MGDFVFMLLVPPALSSLLVRAPGFRLRRHPFYFSLCRVTVFCFCRRMVSTPFCLPQVAFFLLRQPHHDLTLLTCLDYLENLLRDLPADAH